MNQDSRYPNRAVRRKAEREIRKAIKTGVGIDVRLAGYRVVRADGSIKHSVGHSPKEATRDS